jgi:hypothetical protein
MIWKSFHHPDISLPVIRRHAGDELVTLLAGTAELVLSRGLSTIYRNCYPNLRAFNASVSRLKKELHPDDYAGPRAADLHRKLSFRAIESISSKR